MDWNLKKPTWDLTKFNQETIPNMDLVDGSSSFGGQEDNGNFSVDLKLGRMSHSGDESGDKLVQQQQQQRQLVGVLKMASSSSPSGSSKRAKAYNNATQTVSCLVDGCTSDLSNCREYHRRHKVCELHSKTPQVTIGGQKQRFCQQCSRFHSLEEFDEGKRSCRKRLDGHNRRRRKPQPEPMLNSGSYLSNYQGARLFPLSTSHIYPTTSIVSPSWVGAVKTVEDAGVNNHQQPRLNLFDKQNPFSGSYSSSYRGEKQFTFMQGMVNPMFSKSVNTASSQSGGGSSSSHRIFSNGLMTDQVPDSDCALSLLSSSPPPMHTSGIGLSHMVQQSLGSNQNYSSLVEPIDSILVSSVSDANVHCQGMFHMGSNESNNNDEPQTLPFYWD